MTGDRPDPWRKDGWRAVLGREPIPCERVDDMTLEALLRLAKKIETAADNG